MSLHLKIFALICVTALIGISFVPALPQDVLYHDFADRRSFLDIPNFFDVLSNLPFVMVGLLGLWALRGGVTSGGKAGLLLHYRIFFIGVLLTGFGSAYYHWAPDNHTLVWDRLPMTVAFMAFFSALVGESMSLRAGQRLLWPLLLAGFFSVAWWHFTEQAGRGDLRPYVLVQFLPIVLIPYILLAFPAPFRSNRAIWYLIVCYLLAKVLEALDVYLFDLGEIISGHSLKHLSAALATYWMLHALLTRQWVANHAELRPQSNTLPINQ